MTRPNISQIVGEQDFAVLYRWNVIFTLPSAIANSGNYASDTLNFHAISSEYPYFSNEEIETGIHGHKVYQAGMRTYNPITLTFVEDNKATIQNFIRDWGALMWTPGTGVQATKSQYVCPTILLSPMIQTDNTTLLHTYTLRNAWMQTHTIGNPDGSSNEVIKPVLTIRYDYFTEDGQSA